MNPPETDMVNEVIEKEDDKEQNDAVVTIATPNQQCILTIKAVPLPGELGKLLFIIHFFRFGYSECSL